jgi:hypothetical protein
MATGSTVTKEKEHELVLTWVCDAPREPVFKRVPIQSSWHSGGVPMTGVYQELVAPERFVFMRAALDKEGDPTFEVLGTVTFAEQGG